MKFLFIWLVGDLANFFGAVWAGLVPTVIALATYFCFADAILIAQCMYYNSKNSRKVPLVESARNGHSPEEVDEEQPLLRRRSSENVGLPGSRRRPSSASNRRRASSVLSNLPTIPETEKPTREWLKNVGSILLVCLTGALGWLIAWKSGVWQPTSTESVGDDIEEPIGAEILGYLSAVCYLGYDSTPRNIYRLVTDEMRRARIPQIVKNYQERSCEGT